VSVDVSVDVSVAMDVSVAESVLKKLINIPFATLTNTHILRRRV